MAAARGATRIASPRLETALALPAWRRHHTGSDGGDPQQWTPQLAGTGRAAQRQERRPEIHKLWVARQVHQPSSCPLSCPVCTSASLTWMQASAARQSACMQQQHQHQNRHLMQCLGAQGEAMLSRPPLPTLVATMTRRVQRAGGFDVRRCTALLRWMPLRRDLWIPLSSCSSRVGSGTTQQPVLVLVQGQVLEVAVQWVTLAVQRVAACLAPALCR